MKVKDIAEAAGVNPDTVRFYTRENLLKPTRNPDNNYQQFDAEDLRRLRFARKARQLGFSLPEIREIQELQQLRKRMTTALSAWQDMPDGTPDGHTICRLIEHWEDPAPSDEVGDQNEAGVRSDSE